MSSEDLVEYLRARLNEEEQWALAASAPYPYADDRPPVPAGGVHWEWVGGENWEPARVDPVTDDFVTTVDGDWNVNLGSVETWRSGTWDMRATVANSMEEVKAGPAGHIAYWDPARVLADIEAKRRIVDRFVALLEYAARPYDKPEHAAKRQPYLNALEVVIRDLVQPYSSRPDFNEDWRTP